MKKHLFASSLLCAALTSAPIASNAQLLGLDLDISALVPTELVLPLVTTGVNTALPLAGTLLTQSPLSSSLFSGFDQVQPLMSALLDGDNFQGLTALYGPLDQVLIPVTEAIQIP